MNIRLASYVRRGIFVFAMLSAGAGAQDNDELERMEQRLEWARRSGNLEKQILEEVRRLEEAQQQSRERLKELEEFYRAHLESLALAAGAGRKLAPPSSNLPKPANITEALSRGMDWLASCQDSNGWWDTGVEGNALATIVFMRSTSTSEARSIGKLRIVVRETTKASLLVSEEIKDPRLLALILWARQYIPSLGDDYARCTDTIRQRLLAMRGENGMWKAVDGSDDPRTSNLALLVLGEMQGASRDAVSVSEGRHSWISGVANTPYAQLNATDRWICSVSLWSSGLKEWSRWSQEMAAYLLNKQEPDGSWGAEDSKQDIASQVNATATALLCLQLAASQ